ncbi:phosphate ABC transporter permease PstA [Nitratiruptor tergarcus]|uniref:Phosphate transport system permease protein PstA n=1 Tax=Nitratiruptor tergarcus DSM 16512 TaxID=1069081 RepID=A0A1W1WU81_9BACT|nr:phosphate ABC transporter permease PstA [Nitratiruptor tergarcus]SMC09755.1 phosphate ABC transporter membrane protein 2, PhoT family [Nitratiruptor tergarcus DSM 16512]
MKRRKIINFIVMTLSTLSALLGIFFLFWILWTLFSKGISTMSLDIFTQDTPPPMSPGGLRNAIVGQLILVGVASAIGIPLGLLAGTYLSEFGKKSRYTEFIRDISDIMMSAPSIVIGAFVYAIIVAPMGHFSGWAGAAALAIMMIPIVLRTTDDMLGLVPESLREAAYALGAPKYKVILQIVYRGAKVGIVTGILLSIARIAGETAPLLFTSFNNNFYTTNLNEAMPTLTVTMFNFATSPYNTWINLGWAAAFLLGMFVFAINLIGRFIIRKRKK